MAKSKSRSKAVDRDEPWDPSDTCEVSPEELIEAVKAEGVMSYDLETTGLSPRKDRIEGVAFYVPNEKDPTQRPIRAWFPFTEGTMDHSKDGTVTPLREPMPQTETMEKLRPIWQLPNVVAIRHNGIFDDAFLYLSSGLDEPLEINNIIADSMLADYVADERRNRYGLKIRVDQVFGHKMTTYNEAVGGQATFGFANKKPLGVYACDDTMWTYRLFRWAIDQIRLQDPPKQHKDDWCSPLDNTPGVYSDLEKIFWKIEMRIQKILMEMELTGCFIDWEWLVTVQERVQRQQQEILDEFKEKVGWVPNLRSPKQVSDFLYKAPEKGGLGVPTKGVDYNEDLDQYATGDKALKHRKEAFPLVGKLLKYRSLSVIDNSFCKKLISLAQEEGRVYARFRQTGTKIGRLCIASGTQVEILRDVSKFPSGIPIEDVEPGDLAYTYDDNLNLTLRPVVKSWKTGHKRVVRVHWRGSGNKHNGHVDLTPDHPVRLIDGSYTPAGELKTGDRCLALSRGVNGDGYARVYPTKSACIGREHRWAYEEVHGPVGELLVHHKDGNKLNNLLENLETKTHSDHSRDHSKEMWTRPETRTAITTAVTNRWNDPDYRAKHHEHMRKMWRDGKFIKPSGREHPQFIELAQEWLEAELWSHAGHPTLVAQANGLNYARVRRFIKEYAIDIKVIQLLHRSDGNLITREHVEAAREQTNQHAMLKMIGVNYYKFKVLQKHFGFDEAFNHTITHVEVLKQAVDVYDLEIEGTHNFIAGELCVHNSSADPVNLMNQPRDKDLIRKAFCSHLENDYDDERNELCLLDADYGQMELRMAAHLANEKNMIEVYSMVGGCSAGPDGGPCERYTFYECFSCHKKAPPIIQHGEPTCSNCEARGSDIEHQKRCRHVDLHQRTSEDVGVPRNPLAKNCVVGDSLVLTEHGWLEIDEIVEKEGRHKKVIGIMGDDGKVRPTDSAYGGGVQKVARVEMEYGLEVTATYDHEFLVMREGKIGRIPVEKLQPGDPVLYMTGRNVHGRETRLPQVEVEARTSFKKATIPTNLDDKTARFLGYFVAEGRAIVDYEGSRYPIDFGFGLHDPDMVKDVHLTFEHVLGEGRAYISEGGDRVDIRVSSKELAVWLAHIGCGLISGEKAIPSCIRRAPWSLKREFLRALFEGDGTVKPVRKTPSSPPSSWTVSYTSKSKRLVRQIQCELMNINVLGYVSSEWRDTDKGRKQYWVWTCRRQRDLVQFAERVGFIGRRKSMLLADALGQTRSDYANRFLDAVEPQLADIYDSVSGKKRDKLREVLRRGKSGPGSKVRFGDTRVELLEDVLPDELKAFTDAGVWTAKIRSITDAGEAEVYDLYEPERTTMVINSVCVLDCNFGLLYRMGAPKFCIYSGLFDENGDPQLEYGQDLITKWHEAYPGIATWHERTIQKLLRDNYIAYNIARRRRRLDVEWKQNDYRAGTQAIQFSVSGSCQDLIKLAMIKLYDYRNAKIANSPPAEAALWRKFKFLIQIHDELLFEGPKAIKEELCVLIKKSMESVCTGLRVPFTADARFGRCWDDLH